MRMLKALLMGMALFAGAASAAEIMVKDAWIREAPPNASALGAFATVHNMSDKARTLVAVSSAAAKKAEMHKSIMENNMAKMVPQGSIEVPAKSEVKLQPGGLHIMLIGPKQALKAGDKVEVVLEFDGGVKIPVSFEVRKGDAMAMPMSGHDHSMMHH